VLVCCCALRHLIEGKPGASFSLSAWAQSLAAAVRNSQQSAHCCICTYNDSKALFLKIAMEVWAQHLAAAGRNSQKPADC